MIINGDGGYSLLDDYIGGPAAQVDWLGPKVSGHLALFLYSSCKLSELLQWLCYDDSTINIVVVIIIITDPCGARDRCRISPPRFLAESRKRRLKQGSFVSAESLVVYFL